MRKIISAIVAVLLAAFSYAQTPGSILSQIGARGVTDEGGTPDYHGYLVLLDAGGKINAAMLPASSNLTATPLTHMYYIDVNGTNATDSGSIVKPFQTLEYALAHITTNAVLIFSPGVHTRASTPIASAAITHLVLVGADPLTTRIDGSGSYSLAFQNSQPSRVDIAGITVDRIDQRNNVTTIVNAYSRGVLSSMSRLYDTFSNSWATLYADPLSTVPTLTTNSTTINSHYATRLTYTPTYATNWSVVPTTVQAALDSLGSYPRLNAATNVGCLLYWDGSNWVTTAAGTSSQVLFGGTNPAFGMLQLGGAVTGPYTNTALNSNSVTTAAIVDDSVTTNKLAQAVRDLIAAAFTTNMNLTGDVVGVYNSNTVIRLHNKALDAPAASNDTYTIVYDHGNNKFTYRPLVSASTVSNWSTYSAIQIVNMANYGLTNVAEITFGGVRRTSWPTASDWSAYTALYTVNMDYYGLTNVGGIELGGVWRTTWPGSDEWSLHKAIHVVDLDDNILTNVAGMELGGVYRTTWPGASEWSIYKATHFLDMDGYAITNVDGLELGGVWRTDWPSAANWSTYPAVGNVNFNGFEATNVYALTLNGVRRTSWPNGFDWSGFPATQGVNMANFGLTNVGSMTLGGVTRSTWPTSVSAEAWATLPATTNVNVNGFGVSNASSIQLGGVTRTNWPTSLSAEEWATMPAVTNVNVANHGISNAASLQLGGVTRTNWPSDTQGQAWAQYPATTNINVAGYGVSNASSLQLGGVARTNWPDVSAWAQYPASTNVDIAGRSVTNAYAIELGGVTRTNWPSEGAGGAYWSGYPATQNVNMANNELTNVSAMTLNGERRTTWPVTAGGDAWSGYPATQTVDMANQGLTNVGAITLGGERRTNWVSESIVSNWAMYRAKQDVDVNNKILYNVSGMVLGGALRTTWPNAADWANYAAANQVNMNNKGLMSVNFVQLGGVIRTNWPVTSEDWAATPASGNVNINSNTLYNVIGIELNGAMISAWPDGATNWSLYAARTNVNMTNFNITGIGKLEFNGWTITRSGGDLVFSNATKAFAITANGKMKQPEGAGAGAVLVSDLAGEGSWTNELNLYKLNVVTTAQVDSLQLPVGASAGYIWTAVDASGKGYWSPYATAVITNEADPIWNAAKTNYYTMLQSDAKYMTNFTEVDPYFFLVITNYYTKLECLALFADKDHVHEGITSGIYADGFHNHDQWYSQKNHLHTGVYAPSNHLHNGVYTPYAPLDRYALTGGTLISNSAVQYGMILSYINATSTVWMLPSWGGGSTNTGGGTNHFSQVSIGPSYMPEPQMLDLYNATNAKINIGVTYVENVQTVSRSPTTGLNRSPGSPAVNPEYGAVIDNLYCGIQGNSGYRTKYNGFTVPIDSYVVGLKVSVRYRKGITSTNAPCYVLVNNNGYISRTNSFTMSATADTTVTLGNSNDVWGLDSVGGPLAGFDVDQTDFGVEIWTTGGGGNAYLIDGVIVEVFYVHNIVSYDMGVNANADWTLNKSGYPNVLEANGTRVRVPIGAYSNWVLTCVDTNGTAMWMPPQTTTNTVPGSILLSGTHTPSAFTNTVTFSTPFTTSMPTVIAGWLNSAIDELAQVEVIGRTSNSFTYRIRSGAGVINTNWSVGWMAADAVLFGGMMASWSTTPAISDVDMNYFALNHVGSLQIGTNAPVTTWPVTRTVSFLIKTPTTNDNYMVWRAPYNVAINRLSAVMQGGTSVKGRLLWYNTGSYSEVPNDVLSGITITTNGYSTTGFSSPNQAANGWMAWAVTNVVGEVQTLSITVDYNVR